MTDWNNKKFVMQAVAQNGMKLQYASEQLKNDREVVLHAVDQNGMLGLECHWINQRAISVLPVASQFARINQNLFFFI